MSDGHRHDRSTTPMTRASADAREPSRMTAGEETAGCTGEGDRRVVTEGARDGHGLAENASRQRAPRPAAQAVRPDVSSARRPVLVPEVAEVAGGAGRRVRRSDGPSPRGERRHRVVASEVAADQMPCRRPASAAPAERAAPAELAASAATAARRGPGAAGSPPPDRGAPRRPVEPPRLGRRASGRAPASGRSAGRAPARSDAACYHRPAMTDRSPLLPHDRHRVREQQARAAHALRGDRRGRHRALAPDAGRRHALPDRDRRALGQHRPAGGRARAGRPRAFVDEKVELFQAAEDALGDLARTGSSGPPTPTTSRPPRRWSAARTPTATSTSARTRAGTAPTRGSATRPTSSRRPAGRSARTTPRCRSSGSRSGTGSSGCPPTRSGWSATTRTTPTSSSRTTGATRCSGSSAAAWRTSRSAGRGRRWLGDPVPDPRGRRVRPARGRHVGSRGRDDLRLVRRAHQLHHRRRLPRTTRPPSSAGGRPTSTSSARTSPGSTRSTGRRCCGAPGLEAPRQVWVHGWLLSAGGERMSKSRGNFLDPDRLVAALRVRRRALRGAARGAVRPGRRGVVGLVRPALQRRPRQRLRQPRQPDGLDGRAATSTGERPAPRAAGESPLAAAWASDAASDYGERLEGCLLHEALAELWEFVGAANKAVDAEQPWVLAKAAKAGDDGRRGRAPARRPGRPVEAAGWSASPSRRSCRPPARGSSPSSATTSRTGRTGMAGRRSWPSCAGAPTPPTPAGSRRRSRSSRAWTSRQTPPSPPPA